MKLTKAIVKYLIYIPLLFFFLPAFSFYVPGINKVFLCFYISLYVAIFMMFLLKKQIMLHNIIQICKKTPLIYFIIFIFAICINSLCLSFVGISTFSQTFTSILLRIILAIIPTLIYFIELVSSYVSIPKFMKIFMFLFWLNLICGFIAYAGRWFDISIINSIFDFLSNLKLVRFDAFGISSLSAENYFLQKRLTGLYEEPGFLGQFLYFFLPFVYTYAHTNIRIYKNRLFNLIFKKTLIPFTWINLLLTLSPMNLVLGLIITMIYFIKDIKFILKKYWAVLAILLILVFILFQNIDLSDTYLKRIINIVTNVHSFEDFILIEASLATRVVGYINGLSIFFQYPLTGVGIGNQANYMYNQYLHSIVPLTPEIIEKTSLATMQGMTPFFIPGFIYSLLAENGIILVCLFLYFYKKIFSMISCIEIKQQEPNNIDSIVLKSLKCSMIALAIDFLYDLSIMSPYLCLIMSMSVVYIYNLKISKNINEEETVNE